MLDADKYEVLSFDCQGRVDIEPAEQTCSRNVRQKGVGRDRPNYAINVDAHVAWTEEAILGESERWVHLPPGGVVVRDAGRMYVMRRSP